MQNIEHTLNWDGYDHFTFGSFKTLSWILLIISGVVISLEQLELGIVLVLVQLQQNSVNYFWSITYDGLGLVLVSDKIFPRKK